MEFANSISLEGLKIKPTRKAPKPPVGPVGPVGDGVALTSVAHPVCPACHERRLKQREAQKRYRARKSTAKRGEAAARGGR